MHLKRFMIVAVVLSSLIPITALYSGPGEATPGEERKPVLDWKQSIGYSRVLTASPVGQGQKLSVIAVTDSGSVYALSPDKGNTLWRFQARDRISSCPAIADVDSDGANDVIVTSHDSFVYALSGDDGRTKWKYRTGGTIYASPVVARLTRKNRFPEVVVATRLGEVHCLRGDGKSAQWQRKLARPIVSSPGVGDVNGDGQPDVVVMMDDGNITILEGYSGVDILRYQVSGGKDTSPVLIDLNRDRKTEVITSAARLEAYGNTRSGWNELWSYGAGEVAFTGSPAIGDLDGDGTLDVVAVDRDGTLHCVNAMSGKPKWKVRVSEGATIASATPIIADLDGSRRAQVIFSAADGHLMAVSGSDGHRLWSVPLGGYADTTPVMFSPDGGKTYAIAASEAATQTVRLYTMAGGGQIFWGKANGDASNTGLFPNALAFGNVLRGVVTK